MNNEVASALRGLYDKFGAQILTQPPRLASLLRDECPERKPEISALVKALEEQVPQDLLNSQSGEPPRSLAARLSRRLSEEHLLARDASNWAVWAWAHGLGLGDEYRNEERSELVVEPGQSPKPPADPALNAVAAPVPPSVIGVRRTSWPIWVAAAAVLIVGALVAQRTVFKPEPPHIVTVDVPKNVRVGKPYTFVVHFDRAPAGIVAVERRVLESTAKWDAQTSNQKVTGMDELNQGTIQYAFDAESRPSKTTLQFVLIDRNGQRSAPQTVAYEILPAPVVCNVCGTISDIQRVDEKRKPKGIGAAVGAVVGATVGHLFGKGKGKTVATAGGAVAGGVAGNVIEGRMTTTHWEVTVKMNSGRRQVAQFDTEPTWQIGQKVKWIDGEIVDGAP